jgi:hypothetical protein
VALRIRLRSNSIKPQIDETVDRLKQRFAGTVSAAAKQFADNVQREGRADIAAAGRFTGAWISGFTYDISGNADGDQTIVFHHAKRLWRIFQKGATIKGDPLLWIPVDPGGPPASKFPGRLFQVKRLKKRGTPLLMSYDDKQVKYIGVKKVIIRRKFHLLRIIRDEASKMRQQLRDGMKNG